MRDPLPIVFELCDRIKDSQYGHRDSKALILLVARTGDWNGAAALIDCFGYDDWTAYCLYVEAYGHDQPEWSDHAPGQPPRPFSTLHLLPSQLASGA